MIIPIPDTSTSVIARKLIEAQEHYTLTTGRVLTLIVLVHADDDLDAILSSVRDASHEHPSRVLVVVQSDPEGEAVLDAELRVGGEAGASEIVIMTLKGALAQEATAVVTPLLLPDTPIVAWWPTSTPAEPAKDPIGALAQRRITNIAYDGTSLADLAAGYRPGDSDMSWAAVTLWRGIVASALDRGTRHGVERVELSGSPADPAADLAAGWLRERLDIPVTRLGGDSWFPISRLTFYLRDVADAADATDAADAEAPTKPATIVIEVEEESAVRVAVPGSPDSRVALSVRSQADTLAEELRHLDADRAYARALHAVSRVEYA